VKHSTTYKDPDDPKVCDTEGCTKARHHWDDHNGPTSLPHGEGLASNNTRSKRAYATALGVANPLPDYNYELNLDILDEQEEERQSKQIKAYTATKKRFRDEDNNLTVEIFIPKTYDEAINCEDAEHWKKAMDAEYQSHIKCGTWVLIPAEDVKKGRKPVGSTWAFDVKRRADGTIERYKARLCAQGFSQVYGHDYDITYSNTVRYSTLRIMFSIAAARNYILSGADIKTAYLNGYIEEGRTLYMRQARGYQETGPDGDGQVL